MLVAYQRAGHSASGRAEGWKALHVDELSDVSILDIPFIVDSDGYRAGGRSKNLATVHCCV